MAYGKDQRAIDTSSSFRQQNARMRASRPNSGGRSQPRFLNEFSPSLDYPDRIRLIRGSYEIEVPNAKGELHIETLSYYPYVDHFHGVLKRGGVCSAGPLHGFKNMRKPCLGCDKYWEQREAGQKKGPMGKRDMAAFTLLHYHPYALVEQVDNRTGQIRTNSEGKPYMVWVPVLAHERAKFQGREMRDWNLMHWSMGFGHMSSLEDYAKTIGQSCRNCGGVGTIEPIAAICANPNCGNAIIEYATTTMPPKQIDQILTDGCKCPLCGHEGLLKEILNCRQCGNGERADIYDVDIQVKKVQASDGSNQNSLNFQGHSAPGPIDPRYAEHAKPLDLPKIYTPTPLEKQAELWGGNPTATPLHEQYRAYGQQSFAAPQPQLAPPGMPMQHPQMMPQQYPAPFPQQVVPQLQPQVPPQMPMQPPAQMQPQMLPQMNFPGFPTGFNPGGIKY